MRPSRLEIEGFTAFRAPAVVDFAGADLFALVGPTGSGKTSIIDALTFALYGSVPRLDDRRAVAPVISQNLTEARVRLDFTVGGAAYTAARVVRATRSGGATTREARLERDGQVLAGTADEVTEAITGLLGLTFEHFTTCVSLPQGQFARFLHDKPRSRQDLLVRLLELGLYERVAGAARQRAAVARNAADLAAGRLDDLAGATQAARDEAAARVGVLDALADRVAQQRPRLDGLAAAEASARADADEVARRVDLLAGLAAPEGVDELAAELVECDLARRRGAELDDEAAGAVAAAEDELAALPDRHVLEGRRADHLRRAELVDSVARGQAAEAEASAAAAGAEAAANEAQARRSAAIAAREEVQVALRARALVPELVVGEPCPVCGHTVDALPAHEAPADLTAAERAVARAEAESERAQAALIEAQKHRARVEEKLAAVRAELDAVDGRLAEAPDLDRVEGDLAQVTAAATALDKARQAAREARRALVAVDRRHRELTAREAEARRSFDAARDRVAALGPPAPERRDLAADWAQLVTWAAAEAPVLAEQLAAHRDEADRARAEASALLEALASACRDAAVDPGPPGTWPGEAVAAEHARAEAAVARIDEQLATAEELRAEHAAAVERHQVADALAGHLAANRFEKWLLDEALHQLVAGASTTLADLSGGAYTLTVDARSGGFGVVDHTNAAQVRSARTLSGGETFLASLALALALADQIGGLAAGGAARLESLFLDEGFGTLDADTLDVVASALDELGARGRMVGVVTHVRELAERLPVRFEVRKVGGAATVDRVEA
ncbi:MAG TPA: SMC family ATPase [Acidimicrobiales bacterium]